MCYWPGDDQVHTAVEPRPGVPARVAMGPHLDRDPVRGTVGQVGPSSGPEPHVPPDSSSRGRRSRRPGRRGRRRRSRGRPQLPPTRPGPRGYGGRCLALGQCRTPPEGASGDRSRSRMASCGSLTATGRPLPAEPGERIPGADGRSSRRGGVCAVVIVRSWCVGGVGSCCPVGPGRAAVHDRSGRRRGGSGGLGARVGGGG
jgi:hypothetical protein